MDSELNLAFGFHQERRFADAARLYHGLLAREPHHAAALHLFGVMHHQCGHSQRAVELIARAVAVRPEAAAFYSNLAEAHRSLGHHEQAVECCETALRLQPDYPEALNNLAPALRTLGRVDQAAEQFRAALRIRPEFALVQNNLGTLLRDLGREEESLAAFRAAVVLDPNLAEARANLGQALVELGDAEEGLTHCQEAVRSRPDFAPGYNNLGNAHRALNHWAEAHAAYAESVRLAPDLPQVHVNHGLAFRGDGRFGDAAASFRRAVDLAPNDVNLWKSLAIAHADDDDHEAAIPFEAIGSVVGRDLSMPQCPAALDTAGAAELARRHREGLSAIVDRDRPDQISDRVVDKITNTYMYISLISLIFPHATLIKVRRDPRDIALSCWMTNFRSIRWANDLDHLAGRFDGHRRLTAHWQAVLPAPVHEVVFEQLVDDFEVEPKRLVGLCGLDWEPACLQFHQIARPVHTASVTQVRQPR